jgi:hypothetical protein
LVSHSQGKNRVLRGIFGRKTGKQAGDWGKLNNIIRSFIISSVHQKLLVLNKRG